VNAQIWRYTVSRTFTLTIYGTLHDYMTSYTVLLSRHFPYHYSAEPSDNAKQQFAENRSLDVTTACLKNVTNLILNNFNKLKPMSIIFSHCISRILFYKRLLYFLTEPAVNLLYLAISHSGINDVAITSSVPQNVIDRGETAAI